MVRRISLALVLHNHQPVGNFGHVIADNHDTAYLPMIEALERHPGVRLGLHYTGPLLDWLRTERPETVERLGGLHARGQVEIVGGGWCEPVLASLPERDRVGPAAAHGRRAGGVCSASDHAERGSRSASGSRTCPPSLARRRLRLDHRRRRALPGCRHRRRRHVGPLLDRGPGSPISVFGTEQGLRYRIPFGTVEDVIDHLRDQRHRGRQAHRRDGRRRREVRRVAHDLGPLLGPRTAGSTDSSMPSRRTRTG